MTLHGAPHNEVNFGHKPSSGWMKSQFPYLFGHFSPPKKKDGNPRALTPEPKKIKAFIGLRGSILARGPKSMNIFFYSFFLYFFYNLFLCFFYDPKNAVCFFLIFFFMYYLYFLNGFYMAQQMMYDIF